VRVTVVLPTFNEIDSIDTVCRAIRTALPRSRILVVDDASPDGTADRAVVLAADLHSLDVLRRPAREGLGAAYRAGLRRAIDDGAEICIQMDADLSHDPATLPALITIVEHGADLAIGSRYVPGGVIENRPRRRRWLSRWGNRFAASLLGLAVRDATSGFRAYRASTLERMAFEDVRSDAYAFQIEMTHRLVQLGGRAVEFPITFRDGSRGQSKMPKHSALTTFLLVVKLWIVGFPRRRRRRAMLQ
jgi:glycosyltransferase involved in cell wall biosynthesis